MEMFKTNYGGLIAKGVSMEEIKAHLPDGKKDVFNGSPLVRPCLNDDTKFQFNALDRETFHETATHIGLSKNELDNVWNAQENTVWSKEEMIQNLSPRVPTIGELFRLWESTPLNVLSLTSVGIAIGHANLVRISDFRADLSIWIT